VGWRKGKAASGINARCWRFTREGGRDEGRGTRDEKAVRRRSGQSAALRRPGSDKESLYMSRPGISHQPAVSIY
jgi:hypothetical protein